MDETKSSKKVGVWGLVILMIMTWVSMSILPLFLLGFDTEGISRLNFLPFAVIILTAFIIGILIGKKIPEEKERIKISVAVGLCTLIFVHIVILPSNRTGLRSIITYSLLLVLPTVVGTLFGRPLKK